MVIPRKVSLGEHGNQPYVYLNCGHVQGKHIVLYNDMLSTSIKDILYILGHHDWGQDAITGSKRCPMCLDIGPSATLCMGIEPAFYVDSGPPTYAFNPCGHMATEKTVKYVHIMKFLIAIIICFNTISFLIVFCKVNLP